MIENDAKRFQLCFGVATYGDKSKILIKNNGKSLIIAEAVVLVFDESEFRMVL